jgi:hypothetical protein
MIETLGDARNTWDIFPNHYKEVAWTVESVPLVNELLFRAGWYEYGVRWLHNRCQYTSVLYFLSLFDQRKLPRKSYGFCMVDTIDETTYITKHTVEDCKCEHAGMEVGQDILKILENGAIPVLSINSSESQQGTVKVDSSTTVAGYVAISHVWSDGLGNPHCNTLPLCQLLRIQESVNSLLPGSGQHIYFWIDTLCVPLIRTFRNMAIQRMADVYRNASRVLVLDSSLLASTLNRASGTEILARIKCSTWSRRLWTFQEGILARGHRLVFQFGDGQFRVDRESK